MIIAVVIPIQAIAITTNCNHLKFICMAAVAITTAMCGFIAQLVEHGTGIAEVTRSNPVEALIFFFLGFFFPIA